MSDFVDPRAGEEIRMDDLDLSNESDYAQNETGFAVGQSIEDEIEMVELSQRDRLKKSGVDDLFKKYENVGIRSNIHRDPNDFIYNNNELRLKDYPDVRLLKPNGDPYAISTLHQKLGMPGLKILGFEDAARGARPKVSLQQAQQLENSVETIQEAETSFTENPIESVSITEAEIDKTIRTINDSPFNISDLTLPIRELRGLDRAMRTVSGELTLNLAKLSHLDKYIEEDQRKLTETDDPELLDRIKKRLENARIERDARLEALSINKKILRSQISRIKETIYRILDSDENLNLREKLKILFREQGITIASILTAFSMIISTVVLAITGGGGPSSGDVPQPQPGEPGFVKKTLEKISKWLSHLAKKIAGVIPGIIGSILSWLLNFLGKTASWLAENMWALFITIAGMIFIALQQYISKGNNS